MHAMHVDDCAEAYVALAERSRAEISGQIFNVSSASYDVAGRVVEALARASGLAPEMVTPFEEAPIATVDGLANFSQWVSSEKLRRLTGWRERKPSFRDGLDDYRRARASARGKAPS